MLILFPLGINLPAGATLQFGQDDAKTVRVQNCDSAGCLALYAITDAEITAMLKGQGVTISVRPQGGETISFNVPLGGVSLRLMQRSSSLDRFFATSLAE
jgi:invasion protein IalB